MGSSDPTLTEKTYRAESTVHHIMFWPAVAALSLALSADAQLENRRRGSVDDDTLGDYIYADYDAGNGLLDREPDRDYGPVPLAEKEQYERPPSRVRVPQPPKRTNSYNDFRSRPSNNGGGLGLRGRDACQSGAKTVGHEDQCDLYYECYEGQGDQLPQWSHVRWRGQVRAPRQEPQEPLPFNLPPGAVPLNPNK